MQCFRILKQLLAITPLLSAQILDSGVGGSPIFVVVVGILIFWLLRAHAKFQNPRTTA